MPKYKQRVFTQWYLIMWPGRVEASWHDMRRRRKTKRLSGSFYLGTFYTLTTSRIAFRLYYWLCSCIHKNCASMWRLLTFHLGLASQISCIADMMPWERGGWFHYHYPFMIGLAVMATTTPLEAPVGHHSSLWRHTVPLTPGPGACMCVAVMCSNQCSVFNMCCHRRCEIRKVLTVHFILLSKNNFV